MQKIYVEVDDNLHLTVRQLQLDAEMKGSKKHLKEMYRELIEQGLEQLQTQTQNQRRF